MLASAFLMIRRPLYSTLFPYTTLFRSVHIARSAVTQELVRMAQPIHQRGKHFQCDIGIAPHKRKKMLAREHGEPREHFRSEEHTSELQSLRHLVCRLLLEKKNLYTI